MTTTAADPQMSAPMTRWVQQARDLGLVVEITHDTEYGVESVSVDIRRPQVEVSNMLDVIHNSERVWIYACRIDDGEHRYSHSARTYGYGAEVRKVEKLSTVRYHIEGLSR